MKNAEFKKYFEPRKKFLTDSKKIFLKELQKNSSVTKKASSRIYFIPLTEKQR